MSTDNFTLFLGVTTVGVFIFGQEILCTPGPGNKKHASSLRLMAELLLLMYALMSHQVIIAGGQAAILVVKILMLFRNGEWNTIPATIRIVSISTPLLTWIALMTASTYQYQMSIPALPSHIEIAGVTAYAFLFGNFIYGLTKKNYPENSTQMKICSLTGTAFLICYSAFRADMVILIIGAINVLRILRELARERRQRLVIH